MKESALQTYLINQVKLRGGVADKVVSKSRRGFPDVLAFIDHKEWLIEVKTETGRLSALQKQFAEECARVGRRYLVIRSKEETDEWLLTTTR
jgi:hypothetical protein